MQAPATKYTHSVIVRVFLSVKVGWDVRTAVNVSLSCADQEKSVAYCIGLL